MVSRCKLHLAVPADVPFGAFYDFMSLKSKIDYVVGILDEHQSELRSGMNSAIENRLSVDPLGDHPQLPHPSSLEPLLLQVLKLKLQRGSARVQGDLHKFAIIILVDTAILASLPPFLQ